MTTHDGAENSVNEGEKNPVDSGKTDDFVPRSHARKLLDEKKQKERELAEVKARLDELEAERKASEEAKLAEEKKWQELAQRKEEELKKKELELKKRDEILEAQRLEREAEKKKAEVLELLGAKFKKPQYEKFLDIDEVPDEPEERKTWIAKFKQENADLLVVTNVTPPPGTAPRSTGNLPSKPKSLEEFCRVAAEYAMQKSQKPKA